MKKLSLTCALILSSMTLACGPDPEPTPRTNKQIISDILLLIDNYVCRAAFECPQRAPLTTLELYRYGDVDTCTDAIDFVATEATDAELDDALAAGRLAIDRVSALDCEAGLRALVAGDACELENAFISLPETCDTLFVGNLEKDAPCVSSDECAGSLVCRGVSGECYGTCIEDTVSCGESRCNRHTEFCDIDPDTLMESCAPFKKVGEPCDLDYQCEGNQDGVNDCNTSADGSMSTCGPSDAPEDLSDENEQCFGYEDCADGLYCSPGTSTCQKLSGLKFAAEGEECVLAERPQSTYCAAGLVCMLVSYTDDVLTGTCAKPLGAGAVCSYDAECSYEFYCKGADAIAGEEGTCEPSEGGGAACSRDAQCETYCTNSVCEPADACMLP